MTESALETTVPVRASAVAEVERAVYAYKGGRKQAGREIGPLTLRVTAGERVALIGPNGCGKSTLINLLSGASSPSSGSVRWFGGASERNARGRIGVVFQSPALDDLLTIRETMRLAGRLLMLRSDRIDRRAAQLIESMGLADRVDDRIGSLSGGLKRRVDLARATMHEPELLLLDEPTAGLDDASAEAFNATLDTLCQTGVAVITATHTLSEVGLADRVVVMSAGRIVLDEPTKIDPEADASAVITGDADRLAQPLATLRCPQIDASTWRIDLASTSDGTLASAVRAAIAAGGRVGPTRALMQDDTEAAGARCAFDQHGSSASEDCR